MPLGGLQTQEVRNPRHVPTTKLLSLRSPLMGLSLSRRLGLQNALCPSCNISPVLCWMLPIISVAFHSTEWPVHYPFVNPVARSAFVFIRRLLRCSYQLPCTCNLARSCKSCQGFVFRSGKCHASRRLPVSIDNAKLPSKMAASK